MKIKIIPVAAGLVAATGLAITGASLAGADPAIPAASYGQPQQAPEGQSSPGGEGTAAPDESGNTDPSKPLRSDEQLLTGDVAAKVTAAAKAKEPNATIERVETDSDGVYEAHMVRADGTRITVQIDTNFAVTNVQEGGAGRGGKSSASPESPTT